MADTADVFDIVAHRMPQCQVGHRDGLPCEVECCLKKLELLTHCPGHVPLSIPQGCLSSRLLWCGIRTLTVNEAVCKNHSRRLTGALSAFRWGLT